MTRRGIRLRARDLTVPLASAARMAESGRVPLDTPYVVIIGALQSADLQNPSGGQWPHYHVHVQAGATIFDSAINLKSLTNIHIEYRVRSFFDGSVFASVTALADGLHQLAQRIRPRERSTMFATQASRGKADGFSRTETI
jgi:Uncharacterized conserved protein (DUF2278)